MDDKLLVNPGSSLESLTLPEISTAQTDGPELCSNSEDWHSLSQYLNVGEGKTCPLTTPGTEATMI